MQVSKEGENTLDTHVVLSKHEYIDGQLEEKEEEENDAGKNLEEEKTEVECNVEENGSRHECEVCETKLKKVFGFK